MTVREHCAQQGAARVVAMATVERRDARTDVIYSVTMQLLSIDIHSFHIATNCLRVAEEVNSVILDVTTNKGTDN